MPSAVVFVPGLTGAELDSPIWGRLTRTIWLSPTYLLSGNFPALQLDVAGYPPVDGHRLEIIGGHPLPAYYGLLMNYLRARGWWVSSARSDWRAPIADDAELLLTEVYRRSAEWPLMLVCHSRGGLVARAALKVLNARGQVGSVSRVVGLGVPHLGSMEAVANVGGYGELQRRLLALGESLPYGTAIGLGLSTIRLTMRTWPSIAELLPDPLRSWLPAGLAPAFYLPATWADAPVPPVDAYLLAAAAAWAALPNPPSWVEWIDVAGYGVSTAYGLGSAADAVSGDGTTRTLLGDGTVPVASAALAPRKRVLTPTSHDSLPLDGRLWPVIHRCLRDGLAEDETLTGRVLQVL